MYYRSKYLILKAFGAIESPFIFSELATHREVANAIGGDVLGAGFCYINDAGEYVCYGESSSLRTKSREEADAAILNRLLGISDPDTF